MTRAIVGLCTLELELTDNDSLKTKRAVLTSLTKRMRNTFNIAIAEIDEVDNPQTAILAFTTVSNSSRHIDQMMTTVLNWIDEHGDDVLVVNETVEVL